MGATSLGVVGVVAVVLTFAGTFLSDFQAFRFVAAADLGSGFEA